VIRRHALTGRLCLAVDAGLVEGGHLVQDCQGGVDEWQRERRARAFAESQVEREQWLELEVLERDTMPDLDRAMGGDQGATRRRAQLDG
jgi:hypothetical protein